MKNKNTLVTFHIGRGGHFHNQGHLSFVECGEYIDHYTNDLFVNFENGHEAYVLTNKKRSLPNLSKLYEKINDNMESPDESDVKRFEKFTGIKLGELYYCDCNGTPLLPLNNDGTGTLDEDGAYDTTYVQDISVCSENEIKHILESDRYLTNEIEAYIQTEWIEIWEEFHPGY